MKHLNAALLTLATLTLSLLPAVPASAVSCNDICDEPTPCTSERCQNNCMTLCGFLGVERCQDLPDECCGQVPSSGCNAPSPPKEARQYVDLFYPKQSDLEQSVGKPNMEEPAKIKIKQSLDLS